MIPLPKTVGLVIFDLDGTIIDSGPGIKFCIQKTMADLALPPLPEEELDSFIGPPLRSSFQSRLGLTVEQAEEGLRLYRKYYYQHGIYNATVYDGIVPLLQYFREKQVIITLGTSKPWVLAHRILRHFGLRTYFDGVFGCYRDGRRDSKAEVLHALLEHYSCPIAGQQVLTEQTLMIGDRFYDVEGAKAWHIPTIGVTYGYGNAKELLEAGAALLINHPMELTKKLWHIF